MTLAVLVMIDGLRPEPLIDHSDRCPNLNALRALGAWTLSASSVMPTVTLPCHMTIFHSVTASRHSVKRNQWSPMEDPIPGLVEVANDAGVNTAFFYSWEKLRDVTRPGHLSYSFFIDDKYALPNGDEAVLKEAQRYLSASQDGFMFVYFGTVDTAGEEYGWMTKKYLDQVELVDNLLGKLQESLPLDSTILVQADHGGHDFGHGTDLKEDMTIPWMVAGPGIKQDYEIQTKVTLLETAPTLARILDIDAHPKWQGKCVDEVFKHGRRPS